MFMTVSGNIDKREYLDEDILTQMKTETGLSLDILSFLINRTK